MTRRLRSTLLLALAGILLVATPVLAYLYRAPVAITENASTAYTMLPIMWNQNNSWLASNGFMASTANDTRVQSLGGLNYPHLVADNKTLTAIAIPANSQTNLYFVTGESASAMDVIVGYGGLVTTADHADLELGANFTIEMRGYFDTTAGASKYFIKKNAAFENYVSPTVSGNISSTILLGEQLQYNDNTGLWIGGIGYAGQRYNSFPASNINRVAFALTKAGNPTGNVAAQLVRVSDNNILGSFGSINAASVPTAPTYAWFYFTSPVTNGATQDVRIVIVQADVSDAANYVAVAKQTSDVASGQLYTQYSGGAWADDATKDAAYSIGLGVTAIGVTSGEHTINTQAGTTNLTLTVDGVLADSATLGSTSTPNNANSYVSAETDTTAYLEYLKIWVGGNLRLHYEPISYIIGTALPDRAGTAQNGAITWGANPAGIGVTLGSMVSSGQPSIGSTTTTSTSDILPVTGGTDWRPIPGVSATLQANPLRPIVTAISDTTTLSEYQVWVWFGIAFVAFITVLVGSRVRGHHLLTGIAASAAVVLMVVWTIFPMLTLAVCVLAIWGGLISERSTSL